MKNNVRRAFNRVTMKYMHGGGDKKADAWRFGHIWLSIISCIISHSHSSHNTHCSHLTLWALGSVFFLHFFPHNFIYNVLYSQCFALHCFGAFIKLQSDNDFIFSWFDGIIYCDVTIKIDHSRYFFRVRFSFAFEKHIVMILTHLICMLKR